MSWSIADMRDPVIGQIIGPKGCWKLKPQLIHNSHTKTVNCISLCSGKIRCKFNTIWLKHSKGNSNNDLVSCVCGTVGSCNGCLILAVIDWYNWLVELDINILSERINYLTKSFREYMLLSIKRPVIIIELGWEFILLSILNLTPLKNVRLLVNQVIISSWSVIEISQWLLNWLSLSSWCTLA